MTAAVAVRERPILMSAPMVRAILDNTKTQTRRVVREKIVESHPDHIVLSKPGESFLRCPYGVVGDRLWVRETFTTFDEGPRDDGEGTRGVLYRAEPCYDDCAPGDISWNWTPSIFMPRALSRITLEITATRIERVQSISDSDAQAEGIERDGTWWRAGTHPVKGSLQCWPTVRRAYERLWNELNAKRGFGWDVNPWVWVIEFKRFIDTAAATIGATEK